VVFTHVSSQGAVTPVGAKNGATAHKLFRGRGFSTSPDEVSLPGASFSKEAALREGIVHRADLRFTMTDALLKGLSVRPIPMCSPLLCPTLQVVDAEKSDRPKAGADGSPSVPIRPAICPMSSRIGERTTELEKPMVAPAERRDQLGWRVNVAGCPCNISRLP